MAKFFDAFILLSLSVCAVHARQAITDEEAEATVTWTHGLQETVSFLYNSTKVIHDSHTHLLFVHFRTYVGCIH